MYKCFKLNLNYHVELQQSCNSVAEIEIRDEDFYLGLDQFARFSQISGIYIPRFGMGLRVPTLKKQRKIF